ncbi:hypothetical protein SVI_1648 [Shewanella violacea DSS12]|uniref:Uncharacterized protein n=1 Tax=Shewanella violacea (strain JCM 10179 / CIP 106290 / LMG 19151 / DSS12) TaxID=637905 RepID=D4ZIX0_SHEVD|nr:hypothetical protein SVI_1648 [Shewanella violacea DSS12]
MHKCTYANVNKNIMSKLAKYLYIKHLEFSR